MDEITLGLRVRHEAFASEPGALRDVVHRIEDTDISRVCVGDHVTFKGGQGVDGLVTAAALAGASTRLVVQTSVYLLPLRHPVPVARQVSSLATVAPGRFVLGVGIGGEDPDEYRACGIDPATRGRRMDEALVIVRRLLSGESVTVDGEFFSLDAVRVLPAPPQPVPIVVGGRSDHALIRTAAHGDGWLGLWVSPGRFAAATARVADAAGERGRGDVAWRHAMYVWCGFGASSTEAREPLAAAMQDLYRIPFEKFERYSPYGTAEQVAEQLQPYVAAGCRNFDLNAVSARPEDAIDAAQQVLSLLRAADTAAA